MDFLKSALYRPGPWDMLVWHWLSLFALVLVAMVVGWLLGALTRTLLGAIASRTRSPWNGALLRRAGGPVTLAWALLVFALLLPLLGLHPVPHSLVLRGVRAAATITVFWGLWRAVAVASEALGASRWALASVSARSVILIGARLARTLVGIAGVITALAILGYPIAGVLAGLGIGGIAVAFAAQKTLENLFGSLSLAVDQPIRVGDSVKADDVLGTVEEIGLRSTRFRTPDRTIVSIPNGRVADMKLESFSARDRMRLACTIGLVYGTTAAQMRNVLAEIERALRAHPKVWPDAMTVRFKDLGPSSLDIEVAAWFEVPESEFPSIRQEMLLQFLEVVEKAGTAFAFPTRTVHVASAPASPTALPPPR
jgi:MscS family membrane protein